MSNDTKISRFFVVLLLPAICTRARAADEIGAIRREERALGVRLVAKLDHLVVARRVPLLLLREVRSK